MSHEIVYSKKWNFDLEEPIGFYKDLNDIKSDLSFFTAYYLSDNDQKLIDKLEHSTRKRFKNKLIESFHYSYEKNKLISRECREKSGLVRWRNTYIYNERGELEKCETFALNPAHKKLELQNYSLFYFDHQGRKNLRKILDPKGQLVSYEVFHYDEKKRLSKKEMFDKENEKIFSEAYQYTENDQLLFINYFDDQGNFERVLRVDK
ncbi:MAG: hypothetical protein IEMM0008_0523 [bacterium]|nr:MAG: hypothetical protein IEMM0008_0523 [bacterium]